MKLKYPVILGSQSPRRRELLKKLIPVFSVVPPMVDETIPKNYTPQKAVSYLAVKKNDFFKNKKNKIIITADTIVCIGNEILGKPGDYAQAKKMLKKLSETKHKVITGICIRCNGLQKKFTESTTVYFKKLSDKDIDYYIQNFKPYDKAGAYAIQEWIGFTGISKIEGCYYNVVGLPVFSLYKALQSFM